MKLVLEEIETMILSSRNLAVEQDKLSFWQRDMIFIDEAKKCIESGDSGCLVRINDQVRSLSQGFGSYCSNLNKLDSLLDTFYVELTNSILAARGFNRLE